MSFFNKDFQSSYATKIPKYISSRQAHSTCTHTHTHTNTNTHTHTHAYTNFSKSLGKHFPTLKMKRKLFMNCVKSKLTNFIFLSKFYFLVLNLSLSLSLSFISLSLFSFSISLSLYFTPVSPYFNNLFSFVLQG